ncbi:MAG: rhomboid family intramembrane serine protease [Spirochaetales bacterium]|nr:rhomboid family intramembrane serine protease [Spirochaetales bacterium]
MKIKYNAPAVLTFTLVSGLILALDSTAFPGLAEGLFSAPARGTFRAGSPLDWFRLISHVAGHAGLEHFLSNFMMILLLGPILEAVYGSPLMLLMGGVTALATGILNALLFPTSLMGASGIVFMMILLASFTNFGKGEIPITFLLVMILFLGREVLASFASNQVSEFAHIIGGLMGAFFGFLRPRKA